MKRKRLYKLVRFLEALPDERFDLRNFLTLDGRFSNLPEWSQHECGTAACVAGWTPLIFPKSGISQGIVGSPRRNGFVGIEMMADFFGGSVQDWDDICFINTYATLNPTRKEVIAKIKKTFNMK